MLFPVLLASLLYYTYPVVLSRVPPEEPFQSMELFFMISGSGQEDVGQRWEQQLIHLPACPYRVQTEIGS
jgi:hypothetical protein